MQARELATIRFVQTVLARYRRRLFIPWAQVRIPHGLPRINSTKKVYPLRRVSFFSICVEQFVVLLPGRNPWNVFAFEAAQANTAPTLADDVIRLIAQLGGFLDRKSDGEPGVKTIWRGLDQAMTAAQTLKALREEVD